MFQDHGGTPSEEPFFCWCCFTCRHAGKSASPAINFDPQAKRKVCAGVSVWAAMPFTAQTRCAKRPALQRAVIQKRHLRLKSGGGEPRRFAETVTFNGPRQRTAKPRVDVSFVRGRSSVPHRRIHAW